MNVRRHAVLLLLCFVALTPVAFAASPNVVISQVFPGGASGSAAYSHDYVELFNTSNAAVPLTGWSLQYGSSTGNFGSTSGLIYSFPPGTTIGANKYLLIRMGGTTAGSPAVPGFDLSGGLGMSATTGKLALANISTTLGCGTSVAPANPCVLPHANIVDLVAWGTSNNAEGTVAGSGITATKGLVRKNAGCTDTDNNAADFVLADATTGLVPRNSTTDPNVCGPSIPVNAPPTIGAPGTISVLENAAPFNVNVTGNDDGGVYAWSATPGTGVSSVSLSSGQGTSTAVFNVTLNANFAGTAQFTASLSDNVNPAATRVVSITVVGETGPSVSFSDPNFNRTNFPRDGSILIGFNEPVTADPVFLSINCATTGTHNDGTVAVLSGGTRLLFTPNVNFLGGEQCTVTLFKDSIHDQDTNDANPGTDTMAADRVWTFTVANAPAPAFGPEVHLTMGNPTGAAADLQTPNNYLMVKPEFTLSYNRDRGTANWVSWHLSTEWTGSLSRFDTFRPDPQVPADWGRVLDTDYSGSGFDRGHLVANADRYRDIPMNQATFLMTNMLPQAPDNNQGPWEDLESYLRAMLSDKELYVVAGGAGIGGVGSNGPATTLANGKVTVPASTWKVVVAIPRGDDDVARVTAGTRTIAVNMPNVQGIRNNDWKTYLTTVDAIEALTGYDLFANVPDAIEAAIEAGTNGVNPPGAASTSATTLEDTATSFALNGAGVGSLTYSVVAGPSHGTVTISGGTATYTPAPEYSGSDSFTFQVSDGTRTSNIAAVSIAVAEVNDAPVVTLTVPATVAESTAVTATTTVTDVDDSSFSYAWTVTKNGAPYAASASFVPDDNGSYGVTVIVTDARGASTSASAVVTVTNVAPAVLGVSGPSAALSLGTAAAISVSFADLGTADTHTASFNWADGSTTTGACAAGVCTGTHTYAAAGIYNVSVTVSDDDGGSASTSFSSVVVFDVDSPSLTAGGSFQSAGGRVTFNLFANYNKGALTGQAQFNAAGASFDATSFEWLVVTGTTATVRGSGTLNGAAGYTMLVTASDDRNDDRIRVQIFDGANAVVFDNAAMAPVNGSVTIHKK